MMASLPVFKMPQKLVGKRCLLLPSTFMCFAPKHLHVLCSQAPSCATHVSNPDSLVPPRSVQFKIRFCNKESLSFNLTRVSCLLTSSCLLVFVRTRWRHHACCCGTLSTPSASSPRHHGRTAKARAPGKVCVVVHTNISWNLELWASLKTNFPGCPLLYDGAP